eukprot:01689.XXX_3293_3592_1 [CDS] Oithona nana genome sequencing.
MQFCKPNFLSTPPVAVISVCQSDQRMLESLSCHLQRCITAEYIPGSRDNKRTLNGRYAWLPARRRRGGPRPRKMY